MGKIYVKAEEGLENSVIYYLDKVTLGIFLKNLTASQ